jgi:hypothetical protein
LLPFLARLACVKRAASVDSEPGSNSRLILFIRVATLRLAARMSFLIAPVITQSLTNYFIASNQIVKQLRSHPGDHESLREDPMLPASKAVSSILFRPPLRRQNRSTQKSSGIKNFSS